MLIQLNMMNQVNIKFIKINKFYLFLFNFIGVDVSYTYRTEDLTEKIESLHAEAVICTIPLGVLKHCIMPDTTDNIKFEPPLPNWKKNAIANLGYGSLNKVFILN